MTTITECLYPDLAALTGYARGCRCPRCKRAKGDYQRRHNQVRHKIVCDRCDRAGEVRIDHADLCWGCLTEDDRGLILAATYQGRYGKCGI